ncbi:drug:proton antiporter [Aureimonas phyllosphaerae]|uniref:drug:proton antiporter n=1 Tax=Aureimonas phyllosphaerae TaxID=1166078 RepID=UPI003A5C617C
MTPYLLFYVENPADSARAIEALFDLAPVERSPTFVLFVLDGMRLGFWRADGVEPAPQPRGENSELSISVDTREAVDQHHAGWQEKGLAVLQAPTEMDFGYTAVASLPGPFRLRVFRPGEMSG